jgi:dihydroorotate dehydrogenase electron transfer subunit
MNLYNSEIIENKKLAKDIFKLKIEKADGERWEPGNFAMILPELKDGFFSLRRAFSIFSLTDNSIEFLIKKVGKITTILEGMRVGEKISYIGPLGTSFEMPRHDTVNTIMIAGGLGIAPLHFLAQEYVKKEYNFKLLYGANTITELISFEADDSLNKKIIYATEDGSYGYKGKVTELLDEILKNDKSDSSLYACGPFMMLYNLHKEQRKFFGKIQVSVEAVMGCGFGVCRGCAIPMKDNTYKMACKDGPIFDLNEIGWDEWYRIYQ